MRKINWPWSKPKDNYLVLLGFIALSQITGLLGTIFTLDAIPTWYIFLDKPFFAPPNWLFGPVWTVLYTFIGISAYLIWRKYKFSKKVREYWKYFWTQLALNGVWTPFFFGLKYLWFAYIVIIAMVIFIYLTIQAGRKHVPWAGYILYPYLAWVTFASFLNLAIALLN